MKKVLDPNAKPCYIYNMNNEQDNKTNEKAQPATIPQFVICRKTGVKYDWQKEFDRVLEENKDIFIRLKDR